MVRKKVIKKSSGKSRKKAVEKPQKNLIKEALLDINKEIDNINKDKRNLTRKISTSDISIEKAREAQRMLQERIANLLAREAAMKEKTSKLSTKEGKLSDRLAKIEKIKSELDGI